MIYFFYGEDAFRSGEKVIQFKKKFNEKNPLAPSPSVYVCEEKGKEVEVGSLIKAVEEKSLFSSKRLIVIRNFLKNSSRENLAELLAFLKTKTVPASDKEVFLIFWEEFLPLNSNPLFQWLLENSTKQEFEKLRGLKLKKWIESQVQKVNPEVFISKPALEKLIAYSGFETLKLANEIEKLASYKEKGTISEKEVEELVEAENSENVFEVTDALSSGDKKRSLWLIQKQLAQGEDPHYLFFMCLSQFRNLLRVSDFYFQGESNQGIIAKQTKLHPFVVQKTLRQVSRYTPQSLRKIYQLFEELEGKMKTGRLEACLALDILAMKV